MRPKHDLTNQTFGRLTALAREPAKNAKSYWLCECSCGSRTSVRADHLRAGRISSCGCLKTEGTRDRSLTHGQSKTPLYRVWDAMLDRCYRPANTAWHNYGGRGITVCAEWRESFENFSRDMAARYQHGLELDRRDTNGNYCKDNCRWLTPTGQARNKRNNHCHEFEGKNRCLAEIVEMTQTTYTTVLCRIRRGWTLHDALYRPVLANRPS